jgi:GTP-binding protein
LIGTLTDATPKVASDRRIGGPHENGGLGLRFLKHIECCSALLFLIDTAGIENRSPADDYIILLEEPKCQDIDLLGKKDIVVTNTMDVKCARENIKNINRCTQSMSLKKPWVTHSGIDNLRNRLHETRRTKIL